MVLRIAPQAVHWAAMIAIHMTTIKAALRIRAGVP